ncbi:hypothetical protein HK405_000103, partial [Cladochytrium tenue]
PILPIDDMVEILRRLPVQVPLMTPAVLPVTHGRMMRDGGGPGYKRKGGRGSDDDDPRANRGPGKRHHR